MAKQTSKTESRARLLAWLQDHQKNGTTIEIRWTSGRPSDSGRSDYFEVSEWGHNEEGRIVQVGCWTRTVCQAFGYRFNVAREALSMGGCGYSKAYQLATELASLAGFPVYVTAPGVFAGPGGWVKP
jgi:hypothetical protein